MLLTCVAQTDEFDPFRKKSRKLSEARLLARKTKYLRRCYNMQIVNYVREATAAFLKQSNINREERVRGEWRGGEARDYSTRYTSPVQRRERARRKYFPVQRDP